MDVSDCSCLITTYAHSNSCILLDELTHLQGTLTPIVRTPDLAVPSDDTLKALEELSADPKNVVYIISGRDQAFLEEHLGHIKGLGMSAEHGGFIREPGSSTWANFTESLDMDWMGEVLEIFKYYTEVSFDFVGEGKKGMLTLWWLVRFRGRREARSRSRRARLRGIIGRVILSGGKCTFLLYD